MRILLASDSKSCRNLVVCYLRDWGFDFTVAGRGEAAWQSLESEHAPILALLDWAIPGVSSLELCQRIRARTRTDHYVYTIVLTARNRRHDLVEATGAGADDYLLQPFTPAELKTRLLVGKRIILLQKELMVARESLRSAATHDSLTGLLNRTEIISFLRLQLAQGRREGTPVGVVLASLDHCKKINATFGQRVGDGVLQEVGRRFRLGLRVHEGLGRYGGAEFLLVLPGSNVSTSIPRAEMIRQRVEKHPILTASGPVNATVSLGVTVADAGSDISMEGVLELADAGLDRAKEEGRNRVEICQFDLPPEP